MSEIVSAALVLADGSVFEGEHIGVRPSAGIASGEVVFNTALVGYQEVITDPSYAGQIITFTYPHIGNYGVTAADDESANAFARGVIVRDLARRHSSWRAEASLETFLIGHGIGGIGGIDTRRLTRILRDTGAMPGAFGPVEGDGAADLDGLRAAAVAEPGTDGIDLVDRVTTTEPYTVAAADGAGKRIVAYDFGVKTTILDHLARLGTVEVVPASTPAAAVLDRRPDGVFLSNGPGDPREAPYATASVADLVGKVPIFGICLGHQILSLAIGGEITKLPFGHHGANHPVRNVATGEVEITSQNHNFAVAASSIAAVADVTHVNLNDGVCEGLRVRGAPAFGVQHHPEASPGPHDSAYLFEQFDRLMDEGMI
ncbi:MAG: glutamine-hydrolyzing carbamoyl-phosphate synthase small subunit [Acidimicrobiia bacterium]|nr:glutamine-hydrolyzing carbamoyl-phosphate synthase small subunit [Acidimicrobiia bacterium]